MATLWHPIVLSVKGLAQKEFIRPLRFWVKWSSGKGCVLMGGIRCMACEWWVGYAQHPPILASQEQLALRGLKGTWQNYKSWNMENVVWKWSCIWQCDISTNLNAPLWRMSQTMKMSRAIRYLGLLIWLLCQIQLLRFWSNMFILCF